MKNFAFLTIHPNELDGKAINGSSRGLPTGRIDTSRFIHACGSDSVVRLDGRFSRFRQLRQIMDHIARMRKIRRYAGFEVHVGSIRKSRCIAAYQITEYREGDVEQGISYKSIPLSLACPK